MRSRSRTCFPSRKNSIAARLVKPGGRQTAARERVSWFLGAVAREERAEQVFVATVSFGRRGGGRGGRFQGEAKSVVAVTCRPSSPMTGGPESGLWNDPVGLPFFLGLSIACLGDLGGIYTRVKRQSKSHESKPKRKLSETEDSVTRVRKPIKSLEYSRQTTTE